MIVIRLPTTLGIRREVRRVREANSIVPRFSRSVIFSPWETGYEQTD
jgi:hypothetical protein